MGLGDVSFRADMFSWEIQVHGRLGAVESHRGLGLPDIVVTASLVRTLLSAVKYYCSRMAPCLPTQQDDVYAALEPFNVSVVGGRVSGVGVAGFTLGGGELIGIIFGIACSDHLGFHLLKDTRGSRVSTA